MAYDDAAKQDHSTFWRQHLDGAPALLELPSDRSRPARQSRRTAQAPLELPAELASSLRALSAANGIPLQATLLAAWSALLSRLSGQPQAVVGVAHPGSALRIMPLLVDASRPQAVTAFLSQCAHALRQAALHSAISFDDIAGPHGSSYHPLCQALLACDAAVPAAHDGAFDIGLVLSTAGGIGGHIAFAADLFDAATAESFARYLVQLLASMAADPAQPVTALAILPPHERQRILVEWNATARDTGPFANAHDFVAAQILRTPDAVAVRHDGRSLTYRELGRRADAVARRLLDEGVKPGDLVALFVRRSTDLVAGLLGILKAGAGYVPVDPSFPADRVACMLGDSAALCVVSERALLPYLPQNMPAVLAEELEPADANVHVIVDPDSVAYAIYTSGSSGKPKGVLLPHRALVNLLAALTSWPGITAADTIVAVTTVSFDISLVEVLLPLTVGARIEIADAATAADGAALARLADACGATMMQATPATWRMLLDAGWQGRPGLKIISGGEPLARELADRLLARVAELWNLYGPSETTTYSTGERVLPGAGLVTIGKPVANTRAYIVDRNLQPVPVSVAGELLLGGHGVGIGYNARPALTAEKFIADPFSGVPGERLYRTGDLARWTRDGRIELLGRIDNQVKLRGFRIEPGEIEAVLALHPAVRQAVVVCREDRPGDKRLAAYLTGRTEIDLDALRASIAAVLPSYMIPSAFVVLERFPLTPTGKVDRGALPVPDRSALAAAHYEAPRGAVEQALARLWQDLLGLGTVGRDDNFFALGGHSLLAGQMIARLRRSQRARLELRDLFDNPTVATLAARLDGAAAADWAPIPAADRGAPLALSCAQQRLWFLDQLDPAASAAYHLPVAFTLSGALRLPVLRQALDALLQRHESLRTTFGVSDGVPFQLIADTAAFELTERDLRGAPADQREAAYGAEIARPFDLTHGPLIRGLLAHTGPGTHQLLLVQHHIVSDGWSLGVMQRELAALYASFSRGAGDCLAPLPLQYADYAAWLRAAPHDMERQVDFWRAQLSGAPELLELPADRPRPARQSYRGGQVALTLSPGLTGALRAFSQAHGATVFMTLLAGWSALMSRYSGQDDIVVGTPAANRPRPELEPLVGFFVNTLALRVRLGGDPGSAELLARIRATTLDAYAHQDVPFDQVVAALNPTRSMSYGPVFQTALAVNNTPPAAAPDGELAMRKADLPHASTHFDLSLLLDDDGTTLAGHIEFSSDLFERASVERIGASLQSLLAAMVAEPSMPVSRLPLLAGDERMRVLEGFNQTAAEYPRDGLVHRLFEQHAAATPQAVALQYHGAAISYAQLDERANQLAHALLAMGLRPDDRVALVLDRSAAMVTAMLAILKAGAAYVPIDTGCPAERMAYILRDAAPKALVTESAMLPRLPRHGVPLLVLDRDAEPVARQPTQRPQVPGLGARNLAQILYTSGSTGAPKGVMIEHRSVLRLVVNSSYAPLTAADCVAHCANPAFDASTWEVWAPLLNGARVLVVPQATLFDPAALNAALVEGGVSALFLTVGLFNEYAEQLAPAFGRLTWLMVGGDVLDPQRIARVAASPSRPRHFLNLYGPTECTMLATAFPIAGLGADAHSVPIGKPISNTQAYILDAHMQPVPVGVVGEIHLGGDGLARGYINRPQLTAERFVHAEHCGGQRVYRSGDLGKWLPDGNIEFMGRNDFQVKIRGFRIEPGEIEARLHLQPGVEQAVALCREDRPGDKRLVAYIAARAPIDVRQLRASLAAVLPAYMVPSAFVMMERLPLTANGKLDRRALPAPGQAALAQRGYEAPQGAIEVAIAGAWQELLALEGVSRHDVFFELGGHSLLAVRLVARLRRQFDADIALSALFEHPTVAGLALVLSHAARAAWAPIPLADRGAPLRLSFAQQRLWFLNQLDPAAGRAYHIPVAYRLTGALQRPALAAALDHLVQRHEILRTTFASVDGVPQLAIAAPGVPFALREHQLCESDKAAFYAREIARPFDLTEGPLIRGVLVQLAPDVHELLLVQHHIVSDGWSLGVFLGELAALYSAFSAGQGSPLPPLAIQYADYAASEDIDHGHVQFWREQLTGAPAMLELPADRPRPARQSYDGGQLALMLDRDLAAALRQLGKAHGATLFMTLLAAWATLLARVSGQGDIVVGAPVANRQRPELEALIGFFVNTLPLRVRLDDDPSVAELLARVKDGTLAAFAHQDVSLDRIVEAVNPARSLSYSPLFQTMLSLNNTPAAGIAMGGLDVAQAFAPLGKSQVDLSLFLEQDGESVHGHIAYATELFDRETVEGFARCLLQLLASMAAAPSQPVSALEILAPDERRKLLAGWNDTARDTGGMPNAHDFIAAQVRRTPDAVALRYKGSSLTYRELDRRANGIAAGLLARGVQPGDLVALFVRRSADMVAGILGILKAGAGYVPVDPSFPADRVAYMLDDSAARCVVSERALAALLPAGAQSLMLEEAQASDAQVHLAVDPASAAYVIYTSGSTGRPKGVLLPHRALANLFVALTDWPGITAADTIVAVTTLSFDISIVEVLLPLTVGARIEIADVATAADGAALARLADACEATIMQATPASWRMLLDAGWQGRPGLKIISGGEPLPRELANRLLARVAQLWNLYGPSETTTYSTGERVFPGDGPVTIGRPVANTQAYIVDRHLQPVPVGVAGELLLGGLGVGIGYNARPELTAEKFIADPFSGVADSRLYRTGDLARWTRDGRIDMVGRIDSQVKLRGFRIELGEIESVLGAQPGVRQAVVLCREDRPGDKRLVAYLAAPAPLALDGVRASLGKALPSYMIPSAFVLLEQFPLTPTGKVDRRALPAPDRSAIATGQFEAPEGAQETAMAQVWQELLGLDRIGRNDNFFAIGGHSLLAGQLIARLRRLFGADLALRDLFDRPTVAELSSALAQAHRSEWTPILAADRSAPLATSLAQQRLWFLHQLDPAASLAYHMPAAYRLRGPLDRDALRAALDRLLARHEALRTTFAVDGGVPHQVVSAMRCALLEHDLSGQPEAALADLCASEIARPFDLGAGPLLRAILVRLGPDIHQLLILQHHIVSDGWSLGVMLAELAALYDAFSRGEPDPLPPLALQYADYAAWQRAPAQQLARAQQTAYWREHLAGAPALLALPTDRPRPARQSYRGASVAVALPAELSAGLRALSQAHGATLFMTLLAAWSTLLARYSGQDDIVVGTPVANRARPELEGLIGFFVNTLALRVNLAADPDVSSFIAQIKTGTLAAYAHQEVPLDEVVDAVKPVRSLAYSPLFQTVLALNNTPSKEGARFGDLRLEAAATPQRTTHFELSLLLDDDGAAVAGQIEYSTDLFERGTIERLAAGLQVLLAAMVANPAMAISRLPVMPEPERKRVLAGFNQTAAQYPHDGLVHQLFEGHADAAPDAAALTFHGENMSYAQLDAHANQLAHALLALGVQPGGRVAILLERSPAMIASMLAVLKAGAAYVPMETTCPAQRMAFILADAAPCAVITDTLLGASLPASAAQRLLVDSAKVASQPAQRPRVAGLGANSLAYVIYTSGSTGVPKGVMIEHRNVLRLVVNSGYAPLTPADCVAHCANPAFDASTWEVWGALLNGARVLVVPHETLLEPKAFNAALIDAGVTALWLTAGLFNEYADKLEGAFGRLTWLLAGGDVLDPATVARVLGSASRPRHLLNGYGPTETTTFATTHAIVSAGGRSIPIGRPIANTTAFILDRHLQPVPVGVVGELHIGGDGVARGYLNQPAMTAERFIADPFSGGGRLYRTGDLGRWLPDGSIEFMGRNDFQVKIRGFRIELGEIEARLAACPGVREALVLAREDHAGEKSLAAYLTAAGAIDIAAIRSTLKSSLPAYMQPSAFVVLERFPLTANGKVDRRALPAPATAARSEQAPEALTADEGNLARIWRDLLRVQCIGPGDSFFDLGGNSLMATRLVSRIEQRYGIDFPLRAVFEAPQLAQMTARIAVEGADWQPGALDDLLSQLENLSDEQASAQLHDANRAAANSLTLG
jgi:amino acid adenylation domain-containing protein